MIIGNSEFRLRNNDSKIFSNLGVNNGFFDSRNLGVDVLLGEGPNIREVGLVTYEIFQVFFSDEEVKGRRVQGGADGLMD